MCFHAKLRTDNYHTSCFTSMDSQCEDCPRMYCSNSVHSSSHLTFNHNYTLTSEDSWVLGRQVFKARTLFSLVQMPAVVLDR